MVRRPASWGASGVGVPSTVVPPLRASREKVALFSAEKFNRGRDTFSRRSRWSPLNSISSPARFVSSWTWTHDSATLAGAAPSSAATVSLPLDASTIAELLLEATTVHATPSAEATGPALATSDASRELLDAVVRLLPLADSPADRRVLAPAIRREIHWWLLTGPQGGVVRQIGVADGRLALVACAIRWLKDHYAEPIRIEDLAAEVGLSISTLNRHFRSATSMSPLQYQKRLRLQRARTRLLADPSDVAGVGHAVGYTSASQFTREYRRMFGAPPREDAVRLQSAVVVTE